MDSRVVALDAAIVRVLNGAGRPVGAGCLVGPRLVLTCAHVVARALELPDGDPASAPRGDITVDFPLVARGMHRVGKVNVWIPVQPDETGDVAGLVLTEAAPDGAAPARLVMAEDVWDHPFRAFGFPPGRDTGEWARGRLLGRGTNGLIQGDDDRSSGFSIGRGFSGTPVWDEEDGGVVGIAVASEARPSVRTSYLLPMKTLVELWPALGSLIVAQCPYRGLDPFLADHKEHFHGRKDLTEQLVKRIDQSSLTAVVGPSGSGKSSLVFAGALPILRERADLAITSCRPSGGETPFDAIAGAMVELGELGMAERQPFTEELEQGRLFNVVDQVLRSTKKKRLVLVIDQFEELFTLDPTERNAFLDLIANALPPVADARSEHIRVVLTLRADFLTHALEHVELAAALTAGLLAVGPMTREQLREVIEKPADGLARYEPGLVDRILNDVGSEPGNLPLLEFALTKLWGKQERGMLTHSAYKKLGEVAGALAKHAEQVYQDKLGAHDEKEIRGLLIQLVHADKTTQPTRQIAHRIDLSEQQWEIVQVLAKNRLAVIGGDGKNKSQDTVELAHEALITAWDQLRTWTEEDRGFLIWRGRLSTAHDQWEGSGRKRGTLLTGLPLVEAEQWLTDHPDYLGPEEQKFIHRSRRKRRWMISGLAALSMVLVVLLVVAVWQGVVVQRQRDVAAAQRLASEAEVNIDQHPLSLLLSLESLRLSPTDEARATLLQGVLQPRHNVFAITGHTATVYAATFSSDGRMIASASRDGTLRRWDAGTGKPIGEPLVARGGTVRGAAFSPNSAVITSAHHDGAVRRWDARTGSPIGEPMRGHTRPVEGVAFSPDGRMIASVSEDGTVRRWDAGTGVPIGEPMVGHRDQVEGVAFSPDGKLIASASLDHTVRLWDTATGQSIGQPLAAHTAWVESVAFSPDGKNLASASEDGTVRRWEVGTGSPIGQLLSGHLAKVWNVAFSPDRRMLATASADKTVWLWDATTGEFIRQLVGHTGPVHGVAFSPDSKVVASASEDGTVRLWDTITGQPVGQPLTGHSDWVFWAAFSPDGRMIATSSRDETVRRWDVRTGQQVGEPLTQHVAEVMMVVFSPDGRVIASASRDGTARRWDVRTGQQIGEPLAGHTGELEGVAFSPDSRVIASASRDGTVRRWDSGTGAQIGQPLTGRPHEVLSVAFSPDGKVVASVSRDGTVQQWEGVTGKPISQPLGRVRPVTGAAFSPDGEVIAVAIDQTVRLWPLGMDQWVRHACALAGRNLRQEEWNEFVGRDTPYVRTCSELPAGHNAPAGAPAAKYEFD